jgi:hypothetical protein
MKRCPKCNRIETDDTLVYCRVDGALLISDSALTPSEIETSILPHVTDASTDRPTAPTRVLPEQQVSAKTLALHKPKRLGILSLIGVLFCLAWRSEFPS